jgi:hypothetical protein
MPDVVQPLAVPAARLIWQYGQRPYSLRLLSPAQEVAMTSKQDFTDEEWTRIRRAPLVAGVAISLADPGGPDRAGQRDDGHAAVGDPAPSQEELLAAVALDIQAMTQHRQNPLGDFKPRGGQQVLEELKGVNELVTAKASPEEVERSAGGCWPRPRRPPMPGRRAASWASAPSG